MHRTITHVAGYTATALIALAIGHTSSPPTEGRIHTELRIEQVQTVKPVCLNALDFAEDTITQATSPALTREQILEPSNTKFATAAAKCRNTN